MKLLTRTDFTSHGRALLSGVLAASMTLAPIPALAGPAADEQAEAEAPAAEAAGEIGGRVASLKFDGEEVMGEDLRSSIDSALADAGYTVVRVKRSGQEAADKNKCDLAQADCLDKIGKYLNKNAKEPFDFFVVGEGAAAGAEGHVIVYDIANGKLVRDFVYTGSNEDVIMVYTLPPSVQRAVADYQVPPAGMSDEEKEVIATLDEPEKTPEEIAEEQRVLQERQEAGLRAYNSSMDGGEQEVDLRKDFKEFCRNGPREDKVTGQDVQTGEDIIERDLRPVCKRGPVFGYWQPKSYAVLTLTALGLAGTGLMYGLALGARGEWKDAKDALESSGLDGSSPEGRVGSNGVTYEDLATDVTAAAFKVRQRAIIGDALLGTTVVFAGLLGIIIWQERQQAKQYIGQQKELKVISDLQVSPYVGRGQAGFGASFSF